MMKQEQPLPLLHQAWLNDKGNMLKLAFLNTRSLHRHADDISNSIHLDVCDVAANRRFIAGQPRQSPADLLVTTKQPTTELYYSWQTCRPKFQLKLTSVFVRHAANHRQHKLHRRRLGPTRSALKPKSTWFLFVLGLTVPLGPPK